MDPLLTSAFSAILSTVTALKPRSRKSFRAALSIVLRLFSFSLRFLFLFFSSTSNLITFSNHSRKIKAKQKMTGVHKHLEGA